MIARWLERLGRLGARHRNSRLLRRLDAYGVRFHQAYENHSYDFAANGEARVLQVLGPRLQARRVFDVGANVGTWTLLAARALPEAQIESFEPVAATHAQLRHNCAGHARIRTHACALSDAPGEMALYLDSERSFMATGVADALESIHGLQPQRATAPATTGDRFCAEHGIDTIDLLKVDVEGLEWRVLAGCGGLLRAQRIRVIQFEYGYVNAAVKVLLKDFYDLLRPLGFAIGKIYPRSVDFRDYQYRHEDFIGPNYLAVRQSETTLIDALRSEG